MFTRVTKFQSDPARLSEMEAMIPTIKGQLAEIDGIANWAMWNDDGSGLAVAVYQDEAAADAATAKIQAVWAGLAPLLTAPPEVTSYANAAKMRG